MAERFVRRSSGPRFGVVLLVAALACADRAGQMEPRSGEPPTASVPETQQQKALYALGAMFGESIARLGLTESEFEWVSLGAEDVALGRTPTVKAGDYRNELKELFAARSEADTEPEAEASAAFLEQAAAAEGAVRSDSGLIMTELAAGDGDKPGPKDTVVVHYQGTFRDGTVFDSSLERGSPARFPLDRVIPCWTEALTQMRVGGKSRIVCPASIAYGERGTPRIPGGAALVFEVELLEIVR